MRIVLKCFGQSFNPSRDIMWDCDYVVAELSPRRVARLRRQIEFANRAWAKGLSLGKTHFSTLDLTAYCDGILGGAMDPALSEVYDAVCGRWWAVLPDEFELPEVSEAIDVEQLCVK